MSAIEVLPPNAFLGALKPPTDADLAGAPGPVKTVWDALPGSLAAEGLTDNREWKSYSKKAGWALRRARGKRTIVWLSPCDRQALTAARAAKLPARIRALFDDAPKYPEGTGIRLHTASAKDLPAILSLAGIKLAN